MGVVDHPDGRAAVNDDSMPVMIARLPRNKANYPVPWFVWWNDEGVPDFRVVKPGAVPQALALRLCWICGHAFLPRENRAFTIGPMCAVNRISAEPPSHYGCAVFAATRCPFLIRPQMTRRERHMPAEAVPPAGFSIRRNPGVALVWVTVHKGWHAFRDGDGGILFDVGEPRRVRWYAEGRAATRAEVLASIESGLPLLLDAAGAGGAEAVNELEAMRQRALILVPSA